MTLFCNLWFLTGNQHRSDGKIILVAFCCISLSLVQATPRHRQHQRWPRGDSDEHMQRLDLADYIIGILMGNINPQGTHIGFYKLADQDL